MTPERCMCGATDCPVCGPLQGYSTSHQPNAHDRELALENVVETVMDYGMWPQPMKGKHKKSEFDLYDFLLEERDPSYFLEMYIGCITGNEISDRIRREQATIKEMLEKHFKDSDIVNDLAAEYASES